MSTQPCNPLAGPQIYTALTKCAASLLVVLLVPFVVGVVQGIRYGFGARDYTFLVLGAVVSFVCSLAYSHVATERARGSSKRAWMFFAVLSGWIPFAFAAYLFFYRGLWGFVHIFPEFQLSSALSAILFTLAGYFACREFYRITEMHRIIEDVVERNESL